TPDSRRRHLRWQPPTGRDGERGDTEKEALSCQMGRGGSVPEAARVGKARISKAHPAHIHSQMKTNTDSTLTFSPSKRLGVRLVRFTALVALIAVVSACSGGTAGTTSSTAAPSPTTEAPTEGGDPISPPPTQPGIDPEEVEEVGA